MKIRLSLLFSLWVTLLAVVECQAQTSYQHVGSAPAPQGNVFRRWASWSSGEALPAANGQGFLSRETVFSQNESLPLGGLFAPDFDLTANLFGGWNRITGLGDTGIAESFDDDFAVGFAYGRRHSNRLRSEFEFTYRSNEAESLGEVQVYSIMKNFLLDIQLPNRFARPYFGIGIGYANVDTDFATASGINVENSGSFAFQPIAGVSLRLKEQLFYYFEYRYFSTTDLGVSVLGTPLEDVSYNTHNLFMGLRAEF